MRPSNVAEQINRVLADDRVLSSLGFDRRAIGDSDKMPTHRPALLLLWDDRWYETPFGCLGWLTVQPVAVDELSNAVLLSRVADVFAGVRPGRGPVRRVAQDPRRPGRFAILARGDRRRAIREAGTERPVPWSQAPRPDSSRCHPGDQGGGVPADTSHEMGGRRSLVRPSDPEDLGGWDDTDRIR